MNTKKIHFSLLLTTCLLSACHENPLKSSKERTNTQFLIKASAAAVVQLQPDRDSHEIPYVYLACMKGQEKTIDCNALYQAMAVYAKSSPMTEFNALRVADLTDKLVFAFLREGYEERLFNNDLED